MQIVNSDYPTSCLSPNFAWDDMAEISLGENQKHSRFEDNDARAIQYTSVQRPYQELQGSAMFRNMASDYNPTTNISNEDSYSNGYKFDDFHMSHYDTRYARESFVRDNNYDPEVMTYCDNQVNLVDVIGGNQQYRNNDM